MALTGSARRRVLIIVENLPVPFDRRVWSEATTLNNAGYEVSIICPTGVGAMALEENIDGIHIYRHPLPIEARKTFGFLAEYAVALFHELRLSFKIARRHGFDVIHACNPPDLICLVGLVHRLHGVKFIFDHHDLNPELYEAKFGRRDLFYHLLVFFERLTFRLSSISIATNESYKQVAVSRGGMKEDRVFVVRSGPNLTRVKPVAAHDKWKNGREFMVGYVGVIGAQEGLDLLLESVTQIVRRRGRSDVQFVIVGDGPERHRISEQSTALGLDDYVTFTGRVDDATLMEVLSTADVCVNPDRPNPMNDKSTMNKIMEYMALRKPIVQYDLTEGKASAQEASLYAALTNPIDFSEKIIALLDDPVLRQKMGDFGQQRVQDVLAWHHEAPKLLAAYDKIYE